jgi:NAD kinase
MIKLAEKIVVVTKKTALEELELRLNTKRQARFYVEHMGGRFDEYQDAHDAYKLAVERLRDALPDGVRAQWIDRSFLPTFYFGGSDLVVTLGPDGLVVNTAKYLDSQYLLAINPDPARVDGLLVPFSLEAAARAISLALDRDINHSVDSLGLKRITMAEARLNDGQELLAVNDLFIGANSHVSARYNIQFDGREENQSTSGIIVSTGAGSTGWFRSIVTGAAGIMEQFAGLRNARPMRERYRFDWESDFLRFCVREPFPSRTSGAEIVYGEIRADRPLTIVSQMPQNGVIFSDGIEEDFLPFNSGAIATVGLAKRRLNLLLPPHVPATGHGDHWRGKAVPHGASA